jgi:pimeloyl-ACP methyl ester carboxylesterase
MHEDADLSLAGHARIVSEIVERLGLTDVTLVENDTGMAQLIAADAPDWLARVVITSCEAFDNYPPGIPGKVVGAVGKLPGGVNFAMQQLRVRPLRRSPLTFGLMTKRPIPHDMFDGWLEPLQTQKAIRRDLTKYLRAVDRQEFTRNAERLRDFDRPALVVWAAEDRVMPAEHGRRLAEHQPPGRYVEVADSRTLIPLDQPVALARLVAEFVAET